MYLYGKNSVRERLRVDARSVKRVYLENGFRDDRLIEALEFAGVPVKRVSERELLRIKRADRLQGIVAEVKDYAYVPLDKLLENAKEKKTSLIFADSINDPHNLGSIIRSAACFGNFSVIIPRHSSCEVNDTVMHVASGGENYVPVSIVNSVSTALTKIKKAGFWVVGTVVEGGENINETSLPFPVCLVMGSEGKGIRHGIMKHLDIKVTLPMEGAGLSLNVAMAAALFCYEAAKQRKKGQRKNG